MSTRLQKIEKLEDSINVRLQVILFTSQNGLMAYKHPITYDESIAIHKVLLSIEDNCKGLAKLTAKAIGMLRACNMLVSGDVDGD